MKRIVLVILLLVGVAAGVAQFTSPGGRGEVTYLTAPVERGNLVTTIRATGTLKALLTVKVGSQLSGQVSELFADFNDIVSKDEPIAQLDPRTFEARVREAEATVEVARSNILIEQAGMEKAAADLGNAVANQSIAQKQPGRCRSTFVEDGDNFLHPPPDTAADNTTFQSYRRLS